MSNQKDISEKILEDYNDVFADIVNSLLFDGQEVVKADELENAAPVSQMKLLDGLHEQERDTAKYWKRGTIIIAAIGIENQSWMDPLIPLRVVSYDGALYKSQVNRYHSEQQKRQPLSPLYPAITLVLYFGRKRWSGPQNLRECFPDLPKELEAFVPDYPIHVMEVSFLTPEQVRRMKSDFRIIADYLVQTREGGSYVPADVPIVHVDETLKLMEAITGDRGFQETMNALAEQGKERVTMGEFSEAFRKQGREEARREYEAVLAEKDRTLTESRRALAEKDRTLTENRRALAEKDRALEALNREIQELKQRYGVV